MRDEWFIRGDVPMTKSEVRAISLSKLELYPGSVLWDVGAGTGSVSVEAALTCPNLQIYAFERKQEAIELIKKNCRKAGTESVTIIEGTAPECFKESPQIDGMLCPTHAFIGGTAGGMEPILNELLEKNPRMRIVLNVIALESVASILDYLRKRNLEAEIVSVQISKAEKAGRYHLMKGQNPVYIISFGGEA